MKTLNGRNVAGMVEHWTNTPAYSYLGSSYGQTYKSYLQLPTNEAVTNNFIQKLQEDVVILQYLPSDAVGLYAVAKGVDAMEVQLSVAGQDFILNGD